MMTLRETDRGFVGQVVLQDGTVAGEGYGQKAENALYFAAKDAASAGFAAGRFYLRMTDRNRVLEARAA